MAKLYNTVIIGAGPSGLMAGIKLGKDTIILEKNEKAGRKLFITGKGRCNLTNLCDEEEFINNVVKNKKFMYSAIYNFNSEQTIKLFEENGCKLVKERGNRVFPKSYKSYDVIDTLVKMLNNSGCAIKYNSEVINISKENDLFIVKTNDSIYKCNNLVVATGGLSYPTTGSTGDGYKFSKLFGHSVIEPVPALVGLRIKESVDKGLVGFTLKNVSLNVKYGKKTLSEFGELAFYKDYLDGAIAITISSLINRLEEKIDLWLDLKPSLNDEVLFNRIKRDIGKCNSVYDLMKGLFPSEFINFFSRNNNIDLNKKCDLLNDEDINYIVCKIKHFELTYLGLNDFNRSIVTSGGVSTLEIDPYSMESKIEKGLYFIGEVVDVDCYTGGFNIQSCFSMAVLCADSINNK